MDNKASICELCQAATQRRAMPGGARRVRRTDRERVRRGAADLPRSATAAGIDPLAAEAHLPLH